MVFPEDNTPEKLSTRKRARVSDNKISDSNEIFKKTRRSICTSNTESINRSKVSMTNITEESADLDHAEITSYASDDDEFKFDNDFVDEIIDKNIHDSVDKSDESDSEGTINQNLPEPNIKCLLSENDKKRYHSCENKGDTKKLEFCKNYLKKWLSSDDTKSFGFPNSIQFHDGVKNLFSVVLYVIDNSRNEQSEVYEVVQEICKPLLTHRLMKRVIMGKTDMECNIVTLRLLYEMMKLDESLAEPIITNVDFRTKAIEKLMPKNVRESYSEFYDYFIKFVTIILVKCDRETIAKCAKKQPTLLGYMFYCMIGAKYKVVKDALKAIMSSIVKNKCVSKEVKMRIFSTAVLQKICGVMLHWTDRSNVDQIRMTHRKNRIGHYTLELLTKLCTCTKDGVVYSAKNDNDVPENPLLISFIQTIREARWDPRCKSLLLKIFHSFPDCLSEYLIYLKPFLKPEPTRKWLNTVRYFCDIIDVLDFNQVPDKWTESFIQRIPFPDHVFHIICPSQKISNYPIEKWGIVLFFSTSLKKIKCLFSDKLPKSDRECFRPCIYAFINKVIPPAKFLLDLLKFGNEVTCDVLDENEISSDTDDEEGKFDRSKLTYEEETEFYTNICELLITLNDFQPEFLDGIRYDFESKINLIIKTCGANRDDRLRYISGQLIFYMFSPKPTSDAFRYVLETAVLSPSLYTDRKEYLTKIFESTKFFIEFPDEITVWIYCLRYVKSIDFVHSVLIPVFEKFANEYDQHTEYIFSLNKTYTSESYDSDHHCKFLRNEYCTPGCYQEHVNTEDTCLPISPFVSAFLSYLKDNEQLKFENELKTFTTMFLNNLINCQVSCLPLLNLIEKYTTELLSFEDVIKYVISVCNKRQYIDFENIENYIELSFHQDHLSTVKGVIKYLLSLNSTCRKSFWIEEQITTELINFDEQTACVLLRACIFYIVRLDLNGHLNTAHVQFILLIYQTFLQNPNFRQTYMKYIVENRHVLDTFLNDDTSSKLNLWPDLIFLLISNYRRCLSKFENEEKLTNLLFRPMRKRFLFKFSCWCENKTDFSSNQELVNFDVKVLQLPPCVVNQLINWITNFDLCFMAEMLTNKVNYWKPLLEALVELVFNYRMHLSKLQISWLTNLLLHMQKKRITDDSSITSKLVEIIRIFPHHIRYFTPGFEYCILNKSYSLAVLAMQYLEYGGKKQQKLIALFSENFEMLQEIPTEIVVRLYEERWPDKLEQRFSEIIVKSDTYMITALILDNVNETDFKNIFFVYGKYFEDDNGKACALRKANLIKENRDSILPSRDNLKLMDLIFSEAGLTEYYVAYLFSVTKMYPKFSECIYDAIYHVMNKTEMLEKLLTGNNWTAFVKHCLEKNTYESIDTLKNIASKIFTIDNASPDDMAMEIFDLMISHSEFVKTLLSSANDNLKGKILDLYQFLIRTNTSLVKSAHIPILLGAYSATLNPINCVLLSIIHTYEENGVVLSNFRPYLWGQAAVLYYDVKSMSHLHVCSMPSANSVFDLFDTKTVENTIEMFPIRRTLLTGEPYHFQRADWKMVEIYDVAFMLPLLSYVLAPECRFSIQKFVRSGAFAILIMCFTSTNSDVRRIAMTCLSRLRNQLQMASNNKRNNEAILWTEFLNSLETSLSNKRLLNTTRSAEPPLAVSLVALFFARASLIISEPLHPLYKLLTFLFENPNIDLEKIFKKSYFFDVADPHVCRIQQKWILNLLETGMKTQGDYLLAERTGILKFLALYYFSSISTKEQNLLILKVFHRMLYIESSNFIKSHAFLPWIGQVISNLTPNHDAEFVKIIIRILFTSHSNFTMHTISFKSPEVAVANWLLLRKMLSNNIDNFDIIKHYTCMVRLIGIDVSTEDYKMLITLVSRCMDEKEINYLKYCLHFYKTKNYLDIESHGNVLLRDLCYIYRKNKSTIMVHEIDTRNCCCSIFLNG